MLSGRPICAPPRLSGVSPMLPLLKRQFQCWFDWRWPCLVLSREIIESLIPLSTTLISSRRSMVWCPWLCAGSSVHQFCINIHWSGLFFFSMPAYLQVQQCSTTTLNTLITTLQQRSRTTLNTLITTKPHGDDKSWHHHFIIDMKWKRQRHSGKADPNTIETLSGGETKRQTMNWVLHYGRKPEMDSVVNFKWLQCNRSPVMDRFYNLKQAFRNWWPCQ